MKVGTVDLVLRMIEAGVIMRDMRMENPIRSIREISHDLSGRALVRLANGRQLTALDIQQEYLGKVTDSSRSGAHNLPRSAHSGPLDADPRRDRNRRHQQHRHRDRLGHQEEAHGWLHEAAPAQPRFAPDRPTRSHLSRYFAPARYVLPTSGPGSCPSVGHRNRHQGCR